MQEIVSISAKNLCFILSADPDQLDWFSRAVRDALVRGNSREELDAIREKACITDAIGEYSISSKGKAAKKKM
jgi:hypothetical protein